MPVTKTYSKSINSLVERIIFFRDSDRKTKKKIFPHLFKK